MTGERQSETFQPVAGVLAFLLPGLGHAFLGEPRRAVLIGAGVLGLFLGGLLIGGVDVVDSREDRWWFIGQAPVGPIAFLVDWVHQSQLKVDDPPPAAEADYFQGQTPIRVKSLAHANEIGSLFATIAGMLNAIAIIDAAWHASPGAIRRRTIRRVEKPSDESPPPPPPPAPPAPPGESGDEAPAKPEGDQA